MLDRIRISYRPFNDATFDINDFSVVDEEKYKKLLAEANSFNPQNVDEIEILADYKNTLEPIVSAYEKIRDIKDLLATLSRSSVKDEKVSQALESAAKDAARTIYYRSTDLSIIENATELDRMKERCEKSSCSTTRRHSQYAMPSNTTDASLPKISKESIQRAIAAEKKQSRKVSRKSIFSICSKIVNSLGGKYKKNSARLLNICKDLIRKYQGQNCKPSCEDDVINLLKSRVLEAKAEIADWKDYDTDYIKIAHTMLAHATFDLLATGKYHLYRGLLNPMSCAENLMDVYKASMTYALENKFIDEVTQREEYAYLLKCISEVG